MIATRLHFSFPEQSFHSDVNTVAVVIEPVGETVTTSTDLAVTFSAGHPCSDTENNRKSQHRTRTSVRKSVGGNVELQQLLRLETIGTEASHSLPLLSSNSAKIQTATVFPSE